MGTIKFGLRDIPWGAQLTTSMNGGTANLREIVELARLGRIETIEDRYPLSRVADAYRDLEEGKQCPFSAHIRRTSPRDAL
jgi:D-arabinose 1-dehydrogenase-like Zn-dependent alcohol dehydrogenase